MMRDDIEFNIRFCEVVEQFPCLYDHSRADYCNRSAQDQAWQKIAQTLDCQAADCKERWKNIRGRYTKYKKQTKLPSGSGVKKIKQYYLAEHLNFLNSFLKSRQTKGNVVTEVKAAQEEDKEEESGDEKVNEDNFEERGDAQSSTQGENDPTNLPQGDDTANTPLPAPNPENKKDCGYRKRARPSSLSDVNSSAQKYFETKKRLLEQKTQSTFEKDSQPDPDMAFLQSFARHESNGC